MSSMYEVGRTYRKLLSPVKTGLLKLFFNAPQYRIYLQFKIQHTIVSHLFYI